MLRGSLSLCSCLFAGGLVVSGAAPVFAQGYDGTGIVRVSDQNIPPSPTVQPVPENGSYNGGYSGETYYENCPPGAAGHGGHQRYVRTFSPPVKRPIYRTGVAYQKMWPNHWSGTGAAPVSNYQYPTVYMPTDTTQLGYYYQHVPYWQPRQGMVPPPPVPSQWHTTIAQSMYDGHAPAGKIFGTAPTAMPVSPNPTSTQQGYGPTPVEIPSEPVTPVIQPSAGLEKSISQPSLIPIN